MRLNFQTIKQKTNGITFKILFSTSEKLFNLFYFIISCKNYNINFLKKKKILEFFLKYENLLVKKISHNYSIETCLPSLQPTEHFEQLLQQL